MAITSKVVTMQTLNFNDREYIEYSLRLKRTYRYIGEHLGRTHTTISREVERNRRPGKKYTAAYAQKLTDERQRRKRFYKSKIDKDPNLYWYIRKKLRGGWAPHVISGVLKTQRPPEAQGALVSTESIYRYIYQGNGRSMGWYHYLPYKRYVRRKHHSRKPRKNTILLRLPIHCRSAEANFRLEFAHWETDSVIYGKQAISVQQERLSRKFCMHKVPNLSADETLNAQIKTFESVPPEAAKTMTYDNGKEGSKHYLLKEFIPDLETYFCDAYASWQKGGVEQLNSIVRRHIPRGTNLSSLTDSDIYLIQEKINNTPRKSLNYLTPNQIFDNLKSSVVH
jgi:transposase, IS30 family